MNALGFRIGIVNGAWVKTREDGRRGPCVGDEATLWRALEEERSRAAGLQEQLAILRDEIRDPKRAKK